jgi:IclR family acetate operon transcriptional repressor
MASDPSTGVQSIQRAFSLLEAIADNDGMATVRKLAAISEIPLPTVHRIIRTMVDLGFVEQLPSRQYALGARLVRLGDGAGRSLGSRVEPHLAELVDRTGETANLAILKGDTAMYIAQSSSRHTMRVLNETGEQVPLHSTAVGKVLLAQLTDEEARTAVRRAGMPARTPFTITSDDDLVADLHLTRSRGYADDNAEHDVGVRSIAAAVPGTRLSLAVSISGPSARLSHETVAEFAPIVRSTAAEIRDALQGGVLRTYGSSDAEGS